MPLSPVQREQIIEALETVAQSGLPPKGAASLIDVGSSGFLSYFERELLDEYTRLGGAACRFIPGPYGSGKTHLLGLLYECAANKGMAVVCTDLSQALSLEDWRAITSYILQNLELKSGGTVRRSLPAILEVLESTGANLQNMQLPHPGFQKAMMLYCNSRQHTPQARLLLQRYLLGERVTAGELKSAGVHGVKNPLSTRNAELVLKTVLSGLHSLGLPGVLLLFDENESTFVSYSHIIPHRILVGANLMRRVIDACASGGLVATLTVFFVLPTFLQNCSLAYEALGQRLRLPREGTNVARWRWPVIPIESVTKNLSPEDFLNNAATKITNLVSQCGSYDDRLMAKLIQHGRDVLKSQAGSGYRRPLMKKLAWVALNQIG